MHFLQLLLPLLFTTVAPTNGSVLLAANSHDFRRIAEKVLPKGMASKITDYLKLLSLSSTQNQQVEEYLAENMRLDDEQIYRQDPAGFVNKNTKRHYSVNMKDIMGHVKGLISAFFNKNSDETKIETRNVDSPQVFDKELYDRVQKLEWKQGLEETPMKLFTKPENNIEKSKDSKDNRDKSYYEQHNEKTSKYEATTKRYFKYFTTKASKVDPKPMYNHNREESKGGEVSFDKLHNNDKESYENDKRFTRIFNDEIYENRNDGQAKDKSDEETDKSFKRISNERIHENRDIMKTNLQAKFPKQQKDPSTQYDPETEILEPLSNPLKYKKYSEEKTPRHEDEKIKKTRFEIEDGSKKEGRTLAEDELAKPINQSHNIYHEEYIGVGKAIKDWDSEPINKIKGTKIPTRKHFTMTTPDIYNRQENFAVPQNKDEPIPESDQEAERFPKERPYLTGIINGKKQGQAVFKPPVKRAPLEPQETQVRRQFK